MSTYSLYIYNIANLKFVKILLGNTILSLNCQIMGNLQEKKKSNIFIFKKRLCVSEPTWVQVGDVQVSSQLCWASSNPIGWIFGTIFCALSIWTGAWDRGSRENQKLGHSTIHGIGAG